MVHWMDCRGDPIELMEYLEKEKLEASQQESKQKKALEEHESRLHNLKKQAPRFCAFTRFKPSKDRYGLDLFVKFSGLSEDLLLTVDMADALEKIGTLDWILVLGKKTWEDISDKHTHTKDIGFGWHDLEIGTGEGRRKVETYVAPAWSAKPAEKKDHWAQFRHKIMELEDTHPGSNAQLPPTSTLKRRFSGADASRPSGKKRTLTAADAEPED